MKILIADKSTLYRDLLREDLSLQGHVVLEAKDGQQALKRIAREKIDLIISDIAMPRLNGIEFHRSLRKKGKYKTIPFVFISADKRLLDRIDLPNRKIDFKLSKGASLEQLLRILKKFEK